MKIIETERLYLRELTMEDKEEFKQRIRNIFKKVKEYQNLKVESMTFSVYLLDIIFITAFTYIPLSLSKYQNSHPGPLLRNPVIRNHGPSTPISQAFLVSNARI